MCWLLDRILVICEGLLIAIGVRENLANLREVLCSARNGDPGRPSQRLWLQSLAHRQLHLIVIYDIAITRRGPLRRSEVACRILLRVSHGAGKRN